MITINKNKFKAGLLIGVLALLTACTTEETFQPGPDVPASCQEVCFDGSNEPLALLLASQEERTVTYTVSRSQASGAIDVPVVVRNAAEGLTIDSSVHFADGETTTEFHITAPQQVEEGTTYNFDVELTGDNVNPYHGEGATRFSGSISFPRKRYARMWFTGMVDYLGYFLTEAYDLGNGSFLFSNFLESGTDIWVRYDKSATSTVECEVTTSPSYVENDTDNPGCWFVYCWDENKDENDGYTEFYPHGKNAKVHIQAMTIYVSTDGYQACVYNPAGQSGWMCLSNILFSDKETEMTWKFINWVFTDTPYEDGYDYDEPDPTNLPVGTVLDATAKFHFDDNNFKAFKQEGVVVGKNYVRFADFLGSGKEVKVHYLGDGTMEIVSDYGYVADGIWYFRDEATGEWYDCYPTGNTAKRLNVSVKLTDKDNYIDYSLTMYQMKLKFQDMIYNGKKGFDDLLIYTW